MKGTLQEHGYYELLVSAEGRRLLLLDDNRKYFWNSSTKNSINTLILTKGIVHKSGDQEFIINQSGHYFLVNETTDLAYGSVPHLYLQSERGYNLFLLPTGFPGESDYEKEIVPTGRLIDTELVDTFAYQVISEEKSKGYF